MLFDKNKLNEIIFPVVPNTMHFAREANFPLHHGRVAHFLKFNNPKNGQELAKGSNTKIYQHKIIFLTVHNTMSFARETN